MKHSYMRLFLAFLGALALSLPVQATFQQGYVVTLGGDTLKGNIDMGSPNAMAHHCRFKSTETGKVTRFTPKELKSFATIDLSRRFVSETVPYYFKDRRLFLEVLLTGRINLYYTYDLVLNDLFYLNKRDANLVDLMFDWDKNKLIALKADYVKFLKKAMVDAPELLPEIEHLKNPTPYALSDLVGRYNRRFDKSAKTAVIPQSPTVAKPDKQMGLSISPGMIIPGLSDLLYSEDKPTNAFCGLSIIKRPREKRNGFYVSVGAYLPTFSVTTKNNKLLTTPALKYSGLDYMLLIPVNASYHFSKNKLQPMVGLDVQTFLNSYDTWFLAGPSFGLSYTPCKRISFSCSLQYIMTQFFTKYIYYDTSSKLNLETGISINL